MTTGDRTDESLPQRKHPAHGILIVAGQPTIIFDTVCTKDRQAWLTSESVHELLRAVWNEATAWRVGRYVVMPDHIHLFAAAADENIDYRKWVKFWKSQFTKRHRNPSHRWQTDQWDTRMRSPEHFADKWNYVRENPVRKGLVARADDWPFQGVIFDWRWD